MFGSQTVWLPNIGKDAYPHNATVATRDCLRSSTCLCRCASELSAELARGCPFVYCSNQNSILHNIHFSHIISCMLSWHCLSHAICWLAAVCCQPRQLPPWRSGASGSRVLYFLPQLSIEARKHFACTRFCSANPRGQRLTKYNPTRSYHPSAPLNPQVQIT